MSNNGLIKMWKRLSERGRMYLVLALCCLMLTVSSGAALFIVGFDGAFALPGSEGGPEATPAAPLNTETGYDKDQNVIDAAAYGATILPETADAGADYVKETLFLGDSNTARMYRLFDYCTAQNAIGSVGMSARQLATFGCAGFAGYSNYLTMPQAVALLQPKRVIITFGTNDLNPSNSADNFVKGYQTGIEAVQAAYPSVDIIVNAIPPLGEQRSGTNLTQSQVDEYNKAIVAMCEQKGWKFLNSAEVLKDPTTGFAKAGYTETVDGIHLTRAAMEALFQYVRTHSYVTEDDRPALTGVPARGEDRDVVVPQVPVVSAPEPTAEPTASPTPEPDDAEPTPVPTQAPAAVPDPVPAPEPDPVPEPDPEPATPQPPATTPDQSETTPATPDQSTQTTPDQSETTPDQSTTTPGQTTETDPGTGTGTGETTTGQETTPTDPQQSTVPEAPAPSAAPVQ